MNTYYVDTSKSPRTAIVQSSSISPINIPDVILGDNLLMSIRFLNNGNPETWNGDLNHNLKLVIGSYAAGAYATSSNWVASASYGYTGSLNLDTGSLTNVMGNNNNINATFELQVTDERNYLRTYVSQPIVIWNKI